MSTHSLEEGWDTVEDAKMVITDIGVLSKKEKAGAEYTVIENTHDGKRANFPEGGKFSLSMTTRYICYTKKSASPQRGFVVVTEMRVLPLGDRPPLGFLPLLNTMDDNSKSFHSKQLLVRFVALEEATEAIVDIIVLSSQRKEEVPAHYKRLPEINGFSICYKIGPVPKKNGGQQSNRHSQGASVATPSTAGGGFPIQKDREGSTKAPRKAIDGLTFQLAQDKSNDILMQFKLEDSFKTLSIQDVESKYNIDFSKWNSLANQT